LYFDAMSKLRTLLFTPLSALLLMLAWPAWASDWVLVANSKAGITQLSQDDVIHIYLGRYRRLDSGVTAEPVDQPADSPLKASFYRQLVGTSLPEINAYWARLVFSGKTQPPRTASSSEEALKFVSSHPGALAYVQRSKVDGRVVVVFEMED
jgi:hypothetical protein